jgi:hypothetical protein
MMTELYKDVPNCNIDQSYEEILRDGPNNCGSQFLGILFMMLYFVFSRYLLLNMITVLVIEGYSESKKLEGLKLTEPQIDNMIETWSHYDKKKSGLMEVSDFLLYLHDIGPPFGMKKTVEAHVSFKTYLNRFLMSQNQRIILSDFDILRSLMKFGLQVYEVGDTLCIHYVDYISVVTNRLFSEPFGAKEEEMGKEDAKERKKETDDLNNQAVTMKKKIDPEKLKVIKEE